MDVQRPEALPVVVGDTGVDEHTGTLHACALQAAKPGHSPSAVRNTPSAELQTPDWQIDVHDTVKQFLAGKTAGPAPHAGADCSPAAAALIGDCTSSCLQADTSSCRPCPSTHCLRQQKQPHSVADAIMPPAGASRTLPPMASGSCYSGGAPVRLASPPAGSDCSAGSEQSCLPVQPAAAADRGVCSPPPPSPAASRQSAPACLEFSGRPSFDHASRDEAISRLRPSLQQSAPQAAAPALPAPPAAPSPRPLPRSVPLPRPTACGPAALPPAGSLCSALPPARLDSTELPITPLNVAASAAAGFGGGSGLQASLQQPWQRQGPALLLHNTPTPSAAGPFAMASHTRPSVWASVTAARPSLSSHSTSSAFSAQSGLRGPPPLHAPAAAAALPPLSRDPMQECPASRRAAPRRASPKAAAWVGSPLPPLGSGSGSDAGSMEAVVRHDRAEARSEYRMNRARAIAKFREKRARRSFNKKVRYGSRQRLAESRPRVRGQFVKAVSAAAAAAAALSQAGAATTGLEAAVAAQ